MASTAPSSGDFALWHLETLRRVPPMPVHKGKPGVRGAVKVALMTASRPCLNGRDQGATTHPPGYVPVDLFRLGGLRIFDQRVMEIAVAGPLHDRLRSLQAHTLVVAFAECGVALTREQVPNLGEPHITVHLGIAAASDVENIARLGLFLDLHFHRTPELPKCLTIDEGLNRCLAADFGSEFPGLLNR